MISVVKKQKNQAKTLSIRLKRSPIGSPFKHRLVLRGLGLRKIRQVVERPNTPQVWGMIHKVWYLVEVENI